MQYVIIDDQLQKTSKKRSKKQSNLSEKVKFGFETLGLEPDKVVDQNTERAYNIRDDRDD